MVIAAITTAMLVRRAKCLWVFMNILSRTVNAIIRTMSTARPWLLSEASVGSVKHSFCPPLPCDFESLHVVCRPPSNGNF